MTSPTQTLVIPAYNESARLAAGFERLRPTLEAIGSDHTEILMIDDGSTDDTMRVAHQVYGHLEHFRLVQHPHNIGKGAAVRTGLAHARYPKVIVADADMSIRPEHFVDILATLERVPFAPGSRVPEGGIRYHDLRRTLLGNAFHQLVRHYTPITVRDTQCGCKGFALAPGRLLAHFGIITGFAYDVELFYLAQRLGFAVEPVTVAWDDIGGSTVHLSRAIRPLLSDLRGIRRTAYQCPAIELGAGAVLEDVRRAALAARTAGLVVARGDENDLVVVPRDSAVAAIGVAQSLGGALRTTTIDELRGRRLDAV